MLSWAQLYCFVSLRARTDAEQYSRRPRPTPDDSCGYSHPFPPSSLPPPVYFAGINPIGVARFHQTSCVRAFSTKWAPFDAKENSSKQDQALVSDQIRTAF